MACATFQTMLDDPRMQVLVAERGGLLGTVTLVIVPNLTQGAWPHARIKNWSRARTSADRGLAPP
ncbi:hypothetical protein [Deinococcus ficus]|uniref:hypothetical protein n=1 Tax=Deinococcus ficus TaxID=317577 RepID=UPI0019A9405C|nr:hypothetical protein [Deinococcus ficus]GHF75627.1 hypothetical protein GCM10017782_11670 [Deinococcus ficus]